MTWWLFDTEELAWEVAGEDHATYDMYAYRLFPVVFNGSEEVPFVVEVTITRDLSEYKFLGYDPVNRPQYTVEFGCSPLSCNRGFKQYKVNRFCLLDDLDVAWRITGEIAHDAKEKHSWEPKPYYLCAVYRKIK